MATNVAFASQNLRRMSAVMEVCTEDWMKTTLRDEIKSFDVGKEMVGLTIKIQNHTRVSIWIQGFKY